MSQTPSVGVVGPSHWAYVASAMVENLEDVLISKKVRGVPSGILAAAEQFFALALERRPKNPPANIANFIIATDALSSKEHAQPQQKVQQLKEYALSLQRLKKPGKITATEATRFTELRDFFTKLQEAGESEAYEEQVRFAAPPVGFRALY